MDDLGVRIVAADSPTEAARLHYESEFRYADEGEHEVTIGVRIVNIPGSVRILVKRRYVVLVEEVAKP